MENQVLNLETIEVNQLPEIKGYESKQKALIKAHPFVQIIDFATEAEAKKNRTALKSGRTELQNGEKTIATKLQTFRKKIKEEVEKLVLITVAAEKKQQEEIDRHEGIKLEKKEEKERLEKERIDAITKIMDGVQEALTSIIDNVTFETIEEQKLIVGTIIKEARENNDFEEQTQFFEMMAQRQSEILYTRVIELENTEQLRLDNIKLKEEVAQRNEERIKQQKAQELERAAGEKEREKLQAKLDAFEKIEKEKEAAADEERLKKQRIKDDFAAAGLKAKKLKEDKARQKKLKPQKKLAIDFLNKVDYGAFKPVKSNDINIIITAALEASNIHRESTIQLIENL